ncbi:MAG: adenylate/guanylate cyclase domain-containing protein [Chloroflexi bacterium OHK40]
MTLQQPNPAQIRTLVSYLPPAVARAIHADPRPLEAPRHERFPAAVLLADVSGFTALTEALAGRGASGVEELTTLLNRYFSRMIGLLEAAGGEVVQFSGDALMAIFPADQEAQLPQAVARAGEAARHMQAAMDEFATLATSTGDHVLAMKIAIGAGKVLAMSIGGVFSRWQYIIAGAPLRQVAEGEQAARRGEIVFSPEARALLAVSPGPGAPRRIIAPADLDWSHADTATLEALRLHIPRAITARLSAVEERWLAELRRMSVVFIGVGGLEDTGDDSVGYFHACMRALQEVTYRYEGSLNKFQVDDKGVIGILLFGAPPMAHADDPLRAVRCALDLQRAAELLGLRMAVGVTTDQVFAGPVGSRTRREYTVMGDAVNLAARLMQRAGPGGVLCDYSTYAAARAEVRWDVLPAIAVKGRAAPVRVYRPQGLASAEMARSVRRGAEQPLVGREAEVRQLEQSLAVVAAGRSQVLFIEGEEGIGKSRMVQELARLMRERGIVGLLGTAESLARDQPYNAWREIFGSYFDLDEAGGPEDRRAIVRARLGQIAPPLLERAPLLNDILALGLPETELTSGLEPEQRQAGLRSLLLELLRLWAAEQPLVLVLEDAHWLDALSWQLAVLTARSLADTGLLLVCVRRAADEEPAGPFADELRAAAGNAVITLGPLSPEQTATLGASRLGVARLSADLARLIAERAAGNPLITEELALSLREQGVVVVEGDLGVLRGDAAELQLPSTLQSLVLSRIDHLPVEEQLTLKVAAVIGPSFSAEALCEVYPEPVGAEVVAGRLDRLVARELIIASADKAWVTHRFRQTVLQEMTYSTLLPTQRRDLHARAAAWYEARPVEDQGAILPQLVHHWRHAGDHARELRYARLAGQRFAAEYANDAALSYIERALQLAQTGSERLELLWLRLQIHERTGQREAQHDDLSQIEWLVNGGDPVQQARVANGWATYYKDISDYPQALAQLASAEALAREAGDQASAARSLTLRGEIYEFQGALSDARACFEAALTMYRALGYRRGEANNLSKLGNLHYYQGEYEAARELFHQVLSIRRAAHDASECFTLSNLGEVSLKLGEADAAWGYWEQALAAARRVGDRSTEALVLGQMGYGDLARGRYGAALESLSRSVAAFRAIGERRRVAADLNDLGMVWRDIGGYAEARRCFEEALAIQTAIGDTRNALFTSLNLGWLLLDEAPDAAGEYYRGALASALASGDREGEAYARSYQAYLAERTGDLATAGEAYRAALVIREEVGAPAAAIEELAGLARVSLARGDHPVALAHARICLAHLDREGAEGMEFPLLVYLSCYNVLRAVGAQDEACRVIGAAYTLLMERATSITDPAIRQGMLHNVPLNRRVIEEWEAAGCP